jgi:nitrate/TMAO reductase-like tetraheme cytochrome c subunit
MCWGWNQWKNGTTEPVNCAKCHERQSETANASVHGIALREGVLAAPTCKDCHGHHDVGSSWQ